MRTSVKQRPSPPTAPNDIRDAIAAAFLKAPDKAGILQGVRPFRKGRPHVRIVLEPSPKNGQYLIPCEGRLECAMALALEIDPDITAFRPQPFKMPGQNGIPLVCDFVARRKDMGFTVIDIKPTGEMQRTSVMERTFYVSRVMKGLGIPYRVVTSRQLEQEPAKQIRNQLRKGANVSLSNYERHCLLKALGTQQMTVSELRTIAINQGASPFAAEKLALLGDITFEICAPWREITQLGATHGTPRINSASWGTVRNVRIPL